MLQILALLILISVAVDVSRRVYAHRAVFAEFGQRTSIAWFVWLFPIPFFLPLFAKSFFAFFLFRIPLGILFFIPALLSARRNQDGFERSGDERVKPALATAHTVSLAAITGIMGVLALTIYSWVFVR
ncbi:MAG: hypothetical protein JWM16_608 [Verrucomicrobiales bacterium]|nr:hypothetical protein [Verrucomicrobiales bacterium]